MKKSKILVPAMAVLAFSTAAAVSGTVAWFSAGRTVTLSQTSTVINPEGALQVALTSGTATSVTGTAITMASKAKLRDASVDIGTNPKAFKAYAANLDSDGHPVNYTDVTAKKMWGTLEDGATEVFYFAEWTATFKLPNNTGDEEFDLFFDYTHSSTTSTSALKNAYRVAMYTSDSTHYTVYAGANTDSTVAYVNGTASTSVASYTTVKGAIDSTSTRAAAKASSNYIGTFVGGTTGITVSFVCWYEGSDASCIDTNLTTLASAEVTTSLQFNAIAGNSYAGA